MYSERPFEQNWHHEVIADKLTRVAGGAIVLVQQRLHLEDLSGSLFGASEQWDHLALRSIAEGNEEWSIYGVVAWVRGRGGILHSEMESYDRLEQVREQIGGPVFEAQYQ